MAKSILQIVIQTMKEGNADKETVYALKQVQASIGAVTTVAASMAAAYAVVDKVIGESVRVTVAYADEVRGLQQITGTSADEASRLLNVMDDLKVSAGTLTMATKTLSKEGLSMNIDTLAQLSDEYLKLGDDAEKTAFLVKNFGKSGLQMAEAMQQGGDKLREMNAAVETNLILTEQQMVAARNYQKSIDDLQDAWKGYQVVIGNQVIPTLTDLLNWLKKGADGWAGYFAERPAYIAQENLTNQLLNEQGLAMAKTGYAQMGLTQATKAQIDATRLQAATMLQTAKTVYYYGNACHLTAEDTTKLAQSQIDEAAAAQEMTDRNKNLLTVIGQVGSESKRYENESKQLLEERMALEAERETVLAQGGKDQIAKLAEIDTALGLNSIAAADNAKAHELATHTIILGLMERKLTADGVLDDNELNWLLAKGQAWGVYSDTVVAEARAAIVEANNLTLAIGSIPENKTITITLQQVGGITPSRAGPTGSNQPRKPLPPMDEGGWGNAGEAYVINPVAAPEVFVPATSGLFMPNADKLMEKFFRSAAGSGSKSRTSGDGAFHNYGTINIIAQPATDLTEILRQARRYAR